MADLDIMHVDMDAFYAEVEKLDNPELRGKAVIVGGKSGRGVVSTASYEARKYGVHSAMPMIKARKLCPHAEIVRVRHKRYEEVSKEIFSIFKEFTPQVEKLSIDEAFLDLKGCHNIYGSSREIGKKIKINIKQKIGLVASVGISYNKFLAKLASTLDKPDGFKIISSKNSEEILDPLEVEKIWGVGKKTQKKLNKMGINTIAELKKIPRKKLIEIFGKIGNSLFELARGIDQRKVKTNNKRKSISQEITFNKNIKNDKKISATLMKMAEKVGKRLREKNLAGYTIFIKIRYPDFTTKTRSITKNNPVISTTEIYQTGKNLLKTNNLLKKPLRLLGIGISNLTSNPYEQLSLFDKNTSNYKLTKTIDELKQKFGEESIKHGIELYED
ncbi:MAG: DNA polymerase IV [Bacillota bacterium]